MRPEIERTLYENLELGAVLGRAVFWLEVYEAGGCDAPLRDVVVPTLESCAMQYIRLVSQREGITVEAAAKRLRASDYLFGQIMIATGNEGI